MTILRVALVLGVSICLSWPAAADGKPFLHRSVKSISTELQRKIQGKDGVLLMDFQDLDGRVTYFGRYLANEIRVALAETDGIKIIDKTVLDELETLDEMTAVKIGKAMGAMTVVYGTVTDFETSVNVNLKVIDIQKGILTGGTSHEIRKTERMAYLIETLTQSERTQLEMAQERNRSLETQYQAAILERIRLKDESDKKLID